MNTTIETADLARKIGKIQAMVFAARKTIEDEKSHECDVASLLLTEADNLMFALKESLESEEAEAA